MLAAPSTASALLLVMLGGGLGSGLRYLVGLFAMRALGPAFPWGTLAVNIIGGLLMGLVAGTLARPMAEDPLRLFLGAGLLGGFTTFSAFSLELFTMMTRGQLALGAAYAALSVACAVAALSLGMMLARFFA